MNYELIFDLFFPRYCVVCGRRLGINEQALCTSCALELPRPPFMSFADNELVRRFWGKVPVVQGSSLLYYLKESDYQHIMSELKFRGRIDLCHRMGRLLATAIISQGNRMHPQQDFFDGIDAIIPIPLSKKRQKSRGYNQAEEIAKGVSAVSGLPVITTLIERHKETKKQTELNPLERTLNVQDAFRIIPTKKPQKSSFQNPNNNQQQYNPNSKDPHNPNSKDLNSPDGKHFLILDDTITMGATTLAAMQTILAAYPHCTFSVCSIALARLEGL